MKLLYKNKGCFVESNIESIFPVYVVDCGSHIGDISIHYLHCNYEIIYLNGKKGEDSLWKKFFIILNKTHTIDRWLEYYLKEFEKQIQKCLNEGSVPRYGDVDLEYFNNNRIKFKLLKLLNPMEKQLLSEK